MVHFKNIHLSPTKYQAPSFDYSSNLTAAATKRRGSLSAKVNLRQAAAVTSKARPKSCGGF